MASIFDLQAGWRLAPFGNTTPSCWSDCLCELGIHHKRSLEIDTLIVKIAMILRSLTLLMGLHPWAKDIIKESVKTSGFAVATRETKKVKNIPKQCSLEVGSLTAYQSFTNTLATGGHKFHQPQLIELLARQSRKDLGQRDSNEFKKI